MNTYLICINQHPDHPCQLVEKSLWPLKPCQDSCQETSYCFDTCSKAVGYERQKLSALQIGAVVDVNDIRKVVPDDAFDLTTFMPGTVKCPIKTGVYELDPAKWKVEIRWQYWCVNAWTYASDEYCNDMKNQGAKTRQIAIISPIETPKEETSSVNEYIKHRNEQIIKAMQCEIECKHKWDEYGHGYKCSECGFYSGDNANLNRLIDEHIYTSAINSVDQEGKKVEPTRKLVSDEIIEFIATIAYSDEEYEMLQAIEKKIQSLRQKEIQNIEEAFIDGKWESEHIVERGRMEAFEYINKTYNL